MDISIPYYEDKTRISNSNIGWFLNKGPAFLHKMLTEDVPEDKNPVLERGTMIHEYLLQPEEFQKDYVIWDKAKPFTVQQKKFCQELANTVEIEPDKAIINAYKEAYSTAGKSEDKILSEGLKIASTLKEYIDFLKSRDERLMITPSEYKMLEKIKQNVKSHKLAYNTIWPLGIESTSPKVTVSDGKENTFVWYHEFHINWEWQATKDYKIKCKSLLDSVAFNTKTKCCTIADLKTTAKLWHFEESMKMYDYCRQLMYYTMAAKWYIENELHDDPSTWDFSYYIIGIDTTGTSEIRVFNLHKWQVLARYNDICHALQDIAWHQANNKWEHSREYYEGDGSEILNL